MSTSYRKSSLRSELAPSVTGGLANVVALFAQTTPFTHAGLRVKRAPAATKGALTLVMLVILAAIIVGIVLCNKYGLKQLDGTQSVQTALQKRFSYGVGTGILAVAATGPLGFLIIGLIILFVLGRDMPLTLGKGTLSNQHLVRRRYYMGVAAGGLFGLVANGMASALLKMDK